MTSSYAFRLLCLSLAVLLLVNAAVGAMVAMCAPAIIRRVERWRAASAARLMFALRVLPAAVALFVVLGICIPSYLRLEPLAMEEDIGLACLIAAALGAAAWGFSLVKAARAMFRSIRYLRRWHARGTRTTIAGMPLWIIDGERTLALAGVFWPELIVSRKIVESLPADQLVAALRHERAHASAWDNLKRLLMLLAPNTVVSRRLEQAWARFTEWCADDRAAEGDQERSVALAAALVNVARIGSQSVPPLGTALMANAEDLEVRVERLLRERTEAHPVPRSLVAGAVLSGGMLMTLALRPATLTIAYRILERLVD